jgi:hypothetical protein
MHRRLMAAGAIAQPGSGENLKSLVPVYNHRPYKPPSGDSSLGTYRQGSDQPFARWPRSQVQRQSCLCAGVTGCQPGEIAILAPAHELDDKPSATDADLVGRSGWSKRGSGSSSSAKKTDVTVRDRPWGSNPHGRHDPPGRSSVDAARATGGVRDEDDEPADDSQAEHDPDPYPPGPSTAPLQPVRAIHGGPPSARLRRLCTLTPCTTVGRSPDFRSGG